MYVILALANSFIYFICHTIQSYGSIGGGSLFKTMYLGSAEKLKQSLDINSDENRLFAL